MRIGIDATGVWGIKDGLLNGMMIYTIQIIKNLIKIDNENKYIIYCRDEIPQQLNALHSSVSFRIFKSKNRKVLQQIKIPVAALFDRLDLMFFPYHSAAIVCPCTSIVTIHDLFPYIVPERFHKTHSSEFHGSIVTSVINKVYWKLMLKLACKRADRIIAVSHSTKKDIVNIFNVPNEKVDVVYEGVDKEYYNVDNDGKDLARFREKYCLPKNYILSVGTHAYKNIEGTIRSFSKFKKKYQNPIKLLIVGNQNYLGKEIFHIVQDLNLEGEIIFTGFFPVEDLKYLYQCAELFLFPSFYEGFGLPVLESFACGTPVVTSTAGSLTEVGGEAALLVDPNNHEEIASTVLKILTDKTFRGKKRQQGFKQVKRFSWEKAARMTSKVFNEVVKE